ncbi:MAG: fibrobacter succinogenes major paralogous domain-containing protein, partial [Dysgonamonadaceae bacterium]|nr:fibrobacter succinogenes major paralogous domain-containing protein [Dysgonamonadaceae bacterium]
GKFVITEKINWLYSVIDDLWGNGLAIDDTPGGNDNPVKNTANDPCPVGYRVPTQYEWALLGHENGDIGDSSNDYFYTDDADNSTIAGHAATPTGNPGITWVRVSDGKAAASDTWTDDGKTRGYALYDSTVWTAAEEKYKNGTELLSDPAAPEPLLFLPAAGYRAFDYGYVYSTGSSGDYWSSVAGGGYSYEMLFTDDSVTVRDITAHAMGMSVRCIAE